MAAVDRISELPETILHRILSFLSHKQAIQTSALSRTWRHVGPTAPKIELRESCFKKPSRASFLFVLGKTLQRYNHHNLPVHEFILEMSSESNHCYLESKSVLDKEILMLLTNMRVKKFDFSVPNYIIAPSVVFRAEFLTELYLSECNFMTYNTTYNYHDHNYDYDQPLFKGLKRLSLTRVHIKAETLEKIIRSSPLIEYLLVSDCEGLKSIPATIFQVKSLTELHLTRCKLTGTYGLLIKRLKTLSLGKVKIPDETLEKIMCYCPLIERVLLTDCVGLRNIRLKNNNNLKHFSGSFVGVRIQSIEIDAPTIETIRIVKCPNWYGHDKYSFPRLKSLYLNRVKLSAELLESFSSSKFPSLEELQLERCYGFSEIQLIGSPIKRLVLIIGSTDQRLVITVYAPNIHYFELSAHFPPRLNFYTETPRDQWKSRVVMLSNRCSDNEGSMLPWILQLSELLKSLSESQMSLNVFPNPFKNLKVEDTKDAGFGKPVPLEHVSLKEGVSRGNRFASFPDFLNCFFLICRPRYISMNWYTTNSEYSCKKEKNKLAEYVILKIIRNRGEMSRGQYYLWEKDLEEISMQVWDANSNGWHTVRVEGTSFPGKTSTDTKIRFQLKWRD